MPVMRKVFYGWYIVAASVGLNFYLSIVFFQGFQVFFLPILHEFGWSRALTSGAFALRSLEAGFLAPAIGFFVDRWGPRAVILWGVVLGGAGMVMLGYIDSLWTFYVAFLIASSGVSGASHGVSWTTAVANWFHRLRGRALGIAMLGPVVGGPFVVVAAIMEGWLGWRTAIVMMGIGVWIVGVPLALVARPRPEPYGYLPDGDAHRVADSRETEAPSLSIEGASNGLTAAQAVRTRDFWVLTTLFAFLSVGISGLMVHLIPLLEGMNYSSAQAASILGLMFLLSGIGRIGAGILVDMIDYRIVLGGLVVLHIVGLLLLTIVGPSQIWLLGIFVLVFGIGFGGTIPLRPFLIMQLFGSRSLGALQGLLQCGATFASIVGPVYYGRVFDTTGSYDQAIYVTLATVVPAIPLTYLLRRPQKIARSVG